MDERSVRLTVPPLSRASRRHRGRRRPFRISRLARICDSRPLRRGNDHLASTASTPEKLPESLDEQCNVVFDQAEIVGHLRYTANRSWHD